MNSLSSRQGIYFCANRIVTYVDQFFVIILKWMFGFCLVWLSWAGAFELSILKLKSNKSDISMWFDLRNRVFFERLLCEVWSA